MGANPCFSRPPVCTSLLMSQIWSEDGQMAGGELDHHQTQSEDGQIEEGELDHYLTQSEDGQIEGEELDHHQTQSEDGQMAGGELDHYLSRSALRLFSSLEQTKNRVSLRTVCSVPSNRHETG